MTLLPLSLFLNGCVSALHVLTVLTPVKELLYLVKVCVFVTGKHHTKVRVKGFDIF